MRDLLTTVVRGFLAGAKERRPDRLYRAAQAIESEKLRRRGGRRSRPRTYRVLRRALSLFLSPLREKKPRGGGMPNWMISDLRAFSQKELSLFPSDAFVSRFDLYRLPDRSSVGGAYAKAVSQLTTDRFSIVVLAPWLKRGGADKGTIQFCNAYAELGYEVLLIATLRDESPWASQLASGVAFLDLGALVAGLDPNEREIVLGRILLQTQPRLLHVINSELGWSAVRRYSRQLHAIGVKICASLFCEDYPPIGQPLGYSVDYLPDCVAGLHAVITDSLPYRDVLRARFAGHEDKFSCIHFHHAAAKSSPADQPPRPRANKVLWAGRFTWQKRVDILYAVAECMPDVAFDVYGDGFDDFGEVWKLRFADLRNVTLRGAFDGFDSIPDLQDYACFLYTSRYDGLPNVLIEAAAQRIPLVGPASIGGLADMLTPRTAWCVADPENAAHYADALRACLSADASARVQAAAALVRDRHSPAKFRANVTELLHRLAIAQPAPPHGSL